MIDSGSALLQLIRRSRLLQPAQLNEIKLQWQPDRIDSEALADRLVRRGWLTPYQVEQLFEGQGEALVLGRFHLQKLVGEGALGEVFQALDRGCRRVVALKVLRPELREDPEVLEQFWQEHQVLASLDHPAFVQAFDGDGDGPQFYFAMEYVDGIDLGRLLQLAGPLPVAAACDYVRQAALGLQYAFEQGLVHRDVKPSNLLAAYATGQMRVLDIGSARREWQRPGGPAAPAGGALMGTADYIAPEQTLNPQGADTRADLYSLGCTLFHLLTGRPPFPGGSLARKLLDHQQTPPPSLRQARPDLPPALDAILQRLLAKRPADRFQTPALVAVALAPFVVSEGPPLDLERYRQQCEAAETLRTGDADDAEAGKDPGTLVDPVPVAPEPKSPPAPAAPWNGEERRASPRRRGNLVSVLVADSLAQQEPIRGWVLDRSAGGLGLLVGEALEIGTLMRVRAERSDVAAQWVPVRIIHCRPERIRWRVGCQFVQKLGCEVLSTFG
jgi:serine/threonine protein kinase